MTSFIVYFDYGTAYPYNGGELIYVSDVDMLMFDFI